MKKISVLEVPSIVFKIFLMYELPLILFDVPFFASKACWSSKHIFFNSVSLFCFATSSTVSSLYISCKAFLMTSASSGRNKFKLMIPGTLLFLIINRLDRKDTSLASRRTPSAVYWVSKNHRSYFIDVPNTSYNASFCQFAGWFLSQTHNFSLFCLKLFCRLTILTVSNNAAFQNQ